MKIASYFTEGELDLALTLFADILTDEDNLKDFSIAYDAGDKLLKLKEKIEFYQAELRE
jgi:hypothetical protein